LEASVTLAYASYFDRVQEAEIFLRRSGVSALQHQLELSETVDEYRELQGTSLHIAANFKRPGIVQLFIKYGADPNAINYYRSSALCAVISLDDRYGSGNRSDIYDYTQVLEILIDGGARPNLRGLRRTPLQAAVLYYNSVELIRILRDAGADVNAVGDDEAVVASLTYRCELEQTDPCHLIHRRGEMHYYGSPLRIAQRKIYEQGWHGTRLSSQERWERGRAEIVAYLESRGAKSFHKFPAEDAAVFAETSLSKSITDDSTAVDDVGECRTGSNVRTKLSANSDTQPLDGYYRPSDGRLYLGEPPETCGMATSQGAGY
jgi:hypothetical protein